MRSFISKSYVNVFRETLIITSENETSSASIHDLFAHLRVYLSSSHIINLQKQMKFFFHKYLKNMMEERYLQINITIFASNYINVRVVLKIK
jgi:hypothetical protein